MPELIHDRYKIIRQIGQGGFGKTFLVEDVLLSNMPRFVVKQFSPSAVNNSPEALRLFKLESDRLAQIGSENEHIPAFIDSFEENEQYYIVQQFIDGQNLAQELSELGAMSQQNVYEVLNEMVPVLNFIHGHQLIHRDIKPENIIRRRTDGKLFLVDFGAAKAVSETVLAKTGTTIGSAMYVSPEQSVGKAIYASDIYSLGVTCVHLLTNVSPFEMMDFYSGGWNWKDFLPESSKVTDGLEKLLDRMIDRTLTKRFKASEDVLAQLKRLDRREIALERRDRIAKIRKHKSILLWSKRSAIGVASAGAVAIAGTGVYFVGSRVGNFVLSPAQNSIQQPAKYTGFMANSFNALANSQGIDSSTRLLIHIVSPLVQGIPFLVLIYLMAAVFIASRSDSEEEARSVMTAGAFLILIIGVL